MKGRGNIRQLEVDRRNDNREFFSEKLIAGYGGGEALHAAEHAYVPEGAAPNIISRNPIKRIMMSRRRNKGKQCACGHSVPPIKYPEGQRQAIAQYPLLETLLGQKALPLRGIWILRDVAKIFDISVRTIQDRIRDGKLIRHDLPGRGKFLTEDLEAFLQNSVSRVGRGSKKD